MALFNLKILLIFAGILLNSSAWSKEDVKKNQPKVIKKASQPAKKSNKVISKTDPKKNVKKRKIANQSDLSRKKIIESYFNCYTNNVSHQTCVQRLLASDLRDSEKDRFYNWLQVNSIKFAGLRTCDDDDRQDIRFFGLSTPDFLCAKILDGKQSKNIIFFFKPERNGAEKLFSFYY